jgi:hypothetical protein
LVVGIPGTVSSRPLVIRGMLVEVTSACALLEVSPMTVEQLRNVYNAQPFRPFVMHLADGGAIPVNHREFIMTVPSGRTVVVAQPDERFNFIDLLLVTDLELKPAAKRPGRRRKA